MAARTAFQYFVVVGLLKSSRPAQLLLERCAPAEMKSAIGDPVVCSLYEKVGQNSG